MKKKIEFDHACGDCKSTGLYIGFGEHDGAAVVCHSCRGTGKAHFKFEYQTFEKREPRKDVKQVYEVNPGIGIGVGKNKEYRLPDFGGMPYGEWLEGKPFQDGMENRLFTCPAWWYQSADYKRKPEWKECKAWGGFSECPSFSQKAKCWERWDREFGKKKK